MVPPFAGAHNHDAEGAPDGVIRRYLGAGVGDPLLDFEQVRRIRLRVKQGRILDRRDW